MIARAIGPQNTAGAIGIIPRMAASAVSMIGRKRFEVASTTASQRDNPRSISCSIWMIRTTELRTIIPISATTPRRAINPRERPDISNAATTPMIPNGAALRARKRSWKLCNWNIKTVNIESSISGTTAATESCDFTLSSTGPPISTR